MQPKLQLKNQQTWLAIQSNAAKTLQFTNQQTWFGILYSQMQPKFSNSQTSKVGWHIIVKCSQNFPIHKSANLVWHTIQSNAAKTLQFTNQQSWLAHCSQLQPILSNPQTSRLAWHTIKAKTLQFTNQQTWLAYYAVKWAKTFQFTNQPSWLACYSQMQPKLFNSQTSEFGQHTIQPKLSNSQISKLGWHTIESNAAKTPQFTNQQSWLAYYKVKWVKTLQFANQQTWSAN